MDDLFFISMIYAYYLFFLMESSNKFSPNINLFLGIYNKINMSINRDYSNDKPISFIE